MALGYLKSKLFYKPGWVLFLYGLIAIAIGLLIIYGFNHVVNGTIVVGAFRLIVGFLIMLTGLLLIVAAITVWLVRLYKRLRHPKE